MRICICRWLSIVLPKNVVFGGFAGEDVKIMSSNSQKALPCVNARLLVYCMSKLVQQSKPSVDKFCIQRKKEIKKKNE